MMHSANDDFVARELSNDELDTVAAGGLLSAIASGIRSGGYYGALAGPTSFVSGLVGGGLLSGMHYFLSHMDMD